MEKFLSTWQRDYSNTSPVLFVDKVRFKINKYTFHFYCKKLDIDNLKENAIHPIPRSDDHPNGTPEAQTKKLQTMKEKGVEFVEQEERKIRLGLQ